MSDAPDELRVYAAYLRRIAFEAVATLQDLSAGQLSWKTGEDGSNTMFAIATHMVAMGEYWVLCLVGGADIVRARQAAQHRLITFLVIAFGMFEWAVRTGRLKNPRAAFVFPILTAVGGAFLLSHSHSLGNFKEELLIELSHLAIGTLGILGGWARWLELRLAKKDSAIASWTWRVCFVLIGLILLFYREA